MWEEGKEEVIIVDIITINWTVNDGEVIKKLYDFELLLNCAIERRHNTYANAFTHTHINT